MIDQSILDPEWLAQPFSVFADEPDEWGWHYAIDPEKTSSKVWSDV